MIALVVAYMGIDLAYGWLVLISRNVWNKSTFRSDRMMLCFMISLFYVVFPCASLMLLILKLYYHEYRVAFIGERFFLRHFLGWFSLTISYFWISS